MQQNSSRPGLEPVIDRFLTPELAALISQEKYNLIIDIILEYFKEKQERLKGVKGGRVFIIGKEDEVTRKYSLFNLIRILNLTEQQEWKAEIFEFFSDEVNIAAHHFFLSDYEHASPYLRILIKPQLFLNSPITKSLVTRCDFPGTVSCLVLNFENRFTFLSREMIKEWNIPEEDLFRVALQYLSGEQVFSAGVHLRSNIDLRVISSAQYSGARMIEIEKNEPSLIGKKGTLFSVPANGIVFASPYENESEALEILEPLMTITADAFKQEPSPVTFDLFHYYKGRFFSMLEFILRKHPQLLEGIISKK